MASQTFGNGDPNWRYKPRDEGDAGVPIAGTGGNFSVRKGTIRDRMGMPVGQRSARDQGAPVGGGLPHWAQGAVSAGWTPEQTQQPRAVPQSVSEAYGSRPTVPAAGAGSAVGAPPAAPATAPAKPAAPPAATPPPAATQTPPTPTPPPAPNFPGPFGSDAPATAPAKPAAPPVPRPSGSVSIPLVAGRMNERGEAKLDANPGLGVPRPPSTPSTPSGNPAPDPNARRKDETTDAYLARLQSNPNTVQGKASGAYYKALEEMHEDKTSSKYGRDMPIQPDEEDTEQAAIIQRSIDEARNSRKRDDHAREEKLQKQIAENNKNSQKSILSQDIKGAEAAADQTEFRIADDGYRISNGKLEKGRWINEGWDIQEENERHKNRKKKLQEKLAALN